MDASLCPAQDLSVCSLAEGSIPPTNETSVCVEGQLRTFHRWCPSGSWVALGTLRVQLSVIVVSEIFGFCWGLDSLGSPGWPGIP